MIDLTILKDRWTEDGARPVFEELVLHCVRIMACPKARRLKPNPGDGGIDTFTGEFDGVIKVWQAKFFPNGLGESQQGQIRESWDSLMKNVDINKVTEWTLCVPVLLDVKAEKWFQGWKKRKEKSNPDCKIHIWDHSHFVAFSTDRRLKAIFDCALERVVQYKSAEEVIDGFRANVPELPLEGLPSASYHSEAMFVRKLELAKITQHTSARTAFYNFELLRTLVSQGGDEGEQKQLHDLLLRVYALWETEFNGREDQASARQFYAAIMRNISGEHQKLLKTLLPAGVVHKQGSMHYWADICSAGWTDDWEVLKNENLPE